MNAEKGVPAEAVGRGQDIDAMRRLNEKVFGSKNPTVHWAAVVERMVAVSLVLGMTAYLLSPVMMAGTTFEMLSAVPLVQTGDDVALTLTQGQARGLLWFNAFMLSLAGYVLFGFMAWVVSRMTPWRNLALLFSSCLSYAVCSGDLVRSAASRVRVPEGADIPVVYLSGWIDIPAVATSGYLEGMSHSALFPLSFAGAAGVALALYRIGRDNIRRRISRLQMGRG